MKKIYPLATSTWDNKEFSALKQTIASGYLSMGRKVEEFEKKFAEFFKTKYAVMVNSGSSANLLAVAALFFRKNGIKLKQGDEVIVPAVSWSTTYYPLQQYGLKVKFVDIDLETLNFNLESLRIAITDKTKMIFAVNLLGNPNDYTVINELIEDKDILFLEDNCESMGASFKGKYTGTFGLMGTFSSYFSHHISTMEGGMIVTDDEELYHILLSLRSHGWTRHLPAKNYVTGEKNMDPFSESFNFVLPGYNVRPIELSGAIGIEQLKKLPTIIKNRRKNAQKFIELVNQYNWLIPQKEIGESSWFGFSLIIKQGVNILRKILMEAFDKYGIEYRPIVAGNFVKNPVIKYFNYENFDDLHNADFIDANGLFIGNHHYNLDNEFELLRKALNQVNNVIK